MTTGETAADEHAPAPLPDGRVGWIGTGVMGRSMAGRLLDAGVEVAIHTRTRAKAEPLLERGATWAADPAEAAAGAACCFSIVGMPHDVEAVHLGPRGTLAADPAPPIVVDLTTSRPSLAASIAERGRERDIAVLDAPVSGGDVGARNGTLSIMVGGDDDAVRHVRPWLERMGRTIVHHGPAGAGQHAKMVNQIVIAGTMVGACEAMLYAERAGLDRERVLDSIRVGAAGSWTLDHLAPRIIARDFGPGFMVEHFVKDLGIALDEAERLGLAVPGLALARQLYLALQAQGGGRDGTQALVLALDRLSGGIGRG